MKLLMTRKGVHQQQGTMVVSDVSMSGGWLLKVKSTSFMTSKPFCGEGIHDGTGGAGAGGDNGSDCVGGGGCGQ